MDQADVAALDAWFIDPGTAKKRAYFFRIYAVREDPEDCRQRIYLKIREGSEPLRKDLTVGQHVENVLRHDRKTRLALHEHTKRDHGVDADDAPVSSARNPERANMMKERGERVIAAAERKCGDSPSGERAKGVLRYTLDRVSDMPTLMKELSGSRTQIYEARRLAAAALEEALARQDKAEVR